MYRRRPNLTAGQFYGEYVQAKPLLVITGLALAFFLLGAVGFGVHIAAQVNDRDNNAELQSHLVSLFGGAVHGKTISWPAGQPSRAYRSQVAANLLHQDRDVDSQYLAPFLNRAELATVARTGQPPALANPQIVAGFAGYLRWTVAFTLPSAGLALLAYVMLGYCIVSLNAREQLVDLPWRKWWVYPFVIVSLPTGAPFYAGSFVRGLWLRSRAPASEVRITDLARRLPSHLKAKQTVAEARRAYLELRGGRQITALHRTARKLEESIASGRWELDHCEDRIEQLQRALPAQRRDLSEAEAALSAFDAAAVTPEAHAAEFDRLLELPGVVGIDVRDNEVIVYCGPVIVQLSRRYFDLGDYTIRLRGNSSGGPHINCARNSSRRRYGHPYHEEDAFCFGYRNRDVKQMLAAGDIVGTASLVMEALFYVNPEDEAMVMKNYPEVKP